MNEAQAKIAGLTVLESTLEFLATKHNTTPQVIADQIRAGHVNLTEQFATLIALGIKEAANHYASK